MKLSEFKQIVREEVRRTLRESKSSNTRRSLKEAKKPKPGSTIDDDALFDGGYFRNDDHGEDWLDLFSDMGNITAARKPKFIAKANEWLKDHGYGWQVKEIIKQDEEGVITWKIA